MIVTILGKLAKQRKVVFLMVIILTCFAIFWLLNLQKQTTSTTSRLDSVKIGYFHGGRTMLLYRAYINHEFDTSSIPVELYTKSLYEDSYQLIPKNYEDIKDIALYGKATGGELINEVVKGNYSGATPGESSFIEAVANGAPLVAVAELGHDTKEKPGHAIIFREGLNIKSPDDIKGKTLSSRRAGDGDAVFLRLFLKSIGLDPDKDVDLLEQVMDDKQTEHLVEGEVDGGFYHLMSVEKLIEKEHATLYSKFNWVNPELSHALLVFHKDFVRDHPDQVEKIVRAYMKRVRYEHSLPQSERLKDPGYGYQKGLQMAKDFMGMDLPQYDENPIVQLELLTEMQNILYENGYLDNKADLSKFIDNSFVQKINEELN